MTDPDFVLVCALNGGAVNGIACYSVESSGLVPDGAGLRSFGEFHNPNLVSRLAAGLEKRRAISKTRRNLVLSISTQADHGVTNVQVSTT